MQESHQPAELNPLSFVVSSISGAIKPKGPAGCDYHALDRAINVVTSLPYIAGERFGDEGAVACVL